MTHRLNQPLFRKFARELFRQVQDRNAFREPQGLAAIYTAALNHAFRISPRVCPWWDAMRKR